MLSTEMTAVTCPTFGAAEVMRLSRVPLPLATSGEVLLKVAAAGVNRADLMQRQGKYPPPPGASTILGMEVSGTVVELGAHTHRWQKGDRVCALLGGGGYADYVSVPENHCLAIPETMNLRDAAALPEGLITVYANLFEGRGLGPKRSVLIHGGSSGIGTIAIQMAKAVGATVFITAKTRLKCDFCLTLGADYAINYAEEDFLEVIRTKTEGHGVDMILDMVGGDYVNRNLQALASFGQHISIATQKGSKAEVDLRLVMQKRLSLTGSTLRSRDAAEKARLVAAVESKLWPLVATGKIKPIIYQSLPLKNVVEAHKVMETGAHIGKIVLEVS